MIQFGGHQGRSVGVEEFNEGHEAFYDTNSIGSRRRRSVLVSSTDDAWEFPAQSVSFRALHSLTGWACRTASSPKRRTLSRSFCRQSPSERSQRPRWTSHARATVSSDA